VLLVFEYDVLQPIACPIRFEVDSVLRRRSSRRVAEGAAINGDVRS
jgi:hypothetical protein